MPLPMLLMKDVGLNSGFMIPQYTAAALVSENKVLAHPASVDNVPTSGGKEDHVSMGTFAAIKFRECVENAERVLAIELLASTQGVEFLAPLEPGVGAAAAHRFVRGLSPRRRARSSSRLMRGRSSSRRIGATRSNAPSKRVAEPGPTRSRPPSPPVLVGLKRSDCCFASKSF